MTDNTYHIISKRQILGTKNEESKILWHNSFITTRNEKGLVILKISTDSADVSKDMKFLEYFVENPKSSATESLFPSNFLKNLNRNIDYVQTINEQIFWPSNPSLMEEKSMISNFEWSPELFTYNNQCILATLTNVGNVELLISHKYGWINCNCNVTKHYIDNQVTSERPSHQLQELKKTLYKYASSAICWQSSINCDGSCNFVTAQKNGDLIIWGIQSTNFGISIALRCILETENCEITSLKLFEVTENYLMLLFSNNYGQVCGYQLKSDNLSVIQNFTLWEHKDKMIVKDILMMSFESNQIICFLKNRHLIIQLLSTSCEIVNQYVQNVNEHKITSITIKDDVPDNKCVLYLSTLDGKVYEVCIKINALVLNVQLNEIRTAKEIINNDQDLQSLSYSKKSGFLFVLIINRAVTIRTNLTKLEFYVMTDKAEDHYVSLILKNPSKQISDVFECIEYMRVKVFKNRILPSLNYKKMYLQTDDIYKLKVYLYFLHYYYSLKSLFVLADPSVFPEMSIEKIKEKIMFLHSKSKVLEIYHNFNGSNENESIIKESFIGAKRYLKYYCDKYKEDLYSHVPNDVLNLVQEVYEYECQGCDKKIEGFTCPDGHPNTFCFSTFTLIDSDKYLTCENCSLIARMELLPSIPKCILCDSFFSMNYDDKC